MMGRFPEVILHLGHEHLDLGLLPAKNAREDGRRVGLDELRLLVSLDLTKLLERRVLGPLANGHLSQ